MEQSRPLGKAGAAPPAARSRRSRPAAIAVVLAAAAICSACGGSGGRKPTLLLAPCWVQSIPAGCGTLRVPESYAAPHGPTIGLHVVVVPARHRPAAPDAFTYLAGGPGAAATEETYDIVTTFAAVHDDRDIILVDQRGTGLSHPLDCAKPTGRLATARAEADYVRACAAAAPGDLTDYGTRAAMDDLDAVRKALGYSQLDVYGVSYGATAAQVYLRRHRSSVRTLILDGATAMGTPFYSRYARDAQAALATVARRCTATPACARRFPHWQPTLSRLIRAWNAHPVHATRTTTLTGDDLAGIVQRMLLDADTAAWIPLVVTDAASGRLGPLNAQIDPGTLSRQLMFWSIWCNEPWVGLGATGPWHTEFDGYTRTTIERFRTVCAALPKREEPASAWTLPRTTVPMLALAGGADPQDPLANLAGRHRLFPNGRAIVLPDYGHGVAQYGCLGGLVSIFIDRASAAGLDTSCLRGIPPPPFVLH